MHHGSHPGGSPNPPDPCRGRRAILADLDDTLAALYPTTVEPYETVEVMKDVSEKFGLVVKPRESAHLPVGVADSEM